MLTPDQLAERMGIAKQTLANWRAKRVGPPSFKVGRLVRYWEADVDAWLRGHDLDTSGRHPSNQRPSP